MTYQEQLHAQLRFIQLELAKNSDSKKWKLLDKEQDRLLAQLKNEMVQRNFL